MLSERFEIATERLLLRSWRITDRADFASMNADGEVMADLGGPLSREASDEKLERFSRAFEIHEITRWVVTDRAGCFIGYCGILPWGDDHPLGVHDEIGWRLIRDAWGHGYATEAAIAALADAFDRRGSSEVLAYTAAENVRSQHVMERLGLRRDPSLDFSQHYDGFGMWSGLVWVCSADNATATPVQSAPRSPTRDDWAVAGWS